jgi:hypothetical protein
MEAQLDFLNKEEVEGTLASSAPYFSSLLTEQPSKQEPSKDDFGQLPNSLAIDIELENLANYVKSQASYKRQQKQAALQSQIEWGARQLESLAECINARATQLEAEMIQFGTIACEVNRAYRAIQHFPNLEAKKEDGVDREFRKQFLTIWQVHSSAVPTVIKCGTKFVLTSKPVDLLPNTTATATKKRFATAQHRRQVFSNWLTAKRVN